MHQNDRHTHFTGDCCAHWRRMIGWSWFLRMGLLRSRQHSLHCGQRMDSICQLPCMSETAAEIVPTLAEASC